MNNLQYATQAADMILRLGRAQSMREYGKGQNMRAMTSQLPGQVQGLFQARDQRGVQAEQKKMRDMEMRGAERKEQRSLRDMADEQAARDIIKRVPRADDGSFDYAGVSEELEHIDPVMAERYRTIGSDRMGQAREEAVKRRGLVADAMRDANKRNWDSTIAGLKKLGVPTEGMPEDYDPIFRREALEAADSGRQYLESERVRTEDEQRRAIIQKTPRVDATIGTDGPVPGTGTITNKGKLDVGRIGDELISAGLIDEGLKWRGQIAEPEVADNLDKMMAAATQAGDQEQIEYVASIMKVVADAKRAPSAQGSAAANTLQASILRWATEKMNELDASRSSSGEMGRDGFPVPPMSPRDYTAAKKRIEDTVAQVLGQGPAQRSTRRPADAAPSFPRGTGAHPSRRGARGRAPEIGSTSVRDGKPVTWAVKDGREQWVTDWDSK